MNKRLLIAAIAAMPLLATAAEPPASGTGEATRAATTPQISQDKLDRIRKALVAQIAVYDAAEGAMRTPTAEEMSVLALPSADGAQAVIALPGGGVALRADGSQASLVKAIRGEDGRITIGHEPRAKAGMPAATKGDGHAH